MKSPVLLGLIMGALGWAASSMIDAGKMGAEFKAHQELQGHPAMVKETRETAVVLERLLVEVKYLGERQTTTVEAIGRLTQEQKADMREVRKALRIPVR